MERNKHRLINQIHKHPNFFPQKSCPVCNFASPRASTTQVGSFRVILPGGHRMTRRSVVLPPFAAWLETLFLDRGVRGYLNEPSLIVCLPPFSSFFLPASCR